MVEEVVLPVYGWECVPSEMHSPYSAIDGKGLRPSKLLAATLKSGPRCLNDEMSENLADAVVDNFRQWANDAGSRSIEFTYGMLYGTQRQSNKKDWHILRNIVQKAKGRITKSHENSWRVGLLTEVSLSPRPFASDWSGGSISEGRRVLLSFCLH
jgi:hypothetical protein